MKQELLRKLAKTFQAFGIVKDSKLSTIAFALSVETNPEIKAILWNLFRHHV